MSKPKKKKVPKKEDNLYIEFNHKEHIVEVVSQNHNKTGINTHWKIDTSKPWITSYSMSDFGSPESPRPRVKTPRGTNPVIPNVKRHSISGFAPNEYNTFKNRHSGTWQATPEIPQIRSFTTQPTTLDVSKRTSGVFSSFDHGNRHGSGNWPVMNEVESPRSFQDDRRDSINNSSTNPSPSLTGARKDSGYELSMQQYQEYFVKSRLSMEQNGQTPQGGNGGRFRQTNMLAPRERSDSNTQQEIQDKLPNPLPDIHTRRKSITVYDLVNHENERHAIKRPSVDISSIEAFQNYKFGESDFPNFSNQYNDPGVNPERPWKRRESSTQLFDGLIGYQMRTLQDLDHAEHPHGDYSLVGDLKKDQSYNDPIISDISYQPNK